MVRYAFSVFLRAFVVVYVNREVTGYPVGFGAESLFDVQSSRLLVRR